MKPRYKVGDLVWCITGQRVNKVIGFKDGEYVYIVYHSDGEQSTSSFHCKDFESCTKLLSKLAAALK